MPEPLSADQVTIYPATSEHWDTIEALFGPKGACAGCWCMFWRRANAADRGKTAEDNRRELKTLVDDGAEPGLVAYVDGAVAGWCAVGPREGYPRLERSRKLARVDDAPVWSIACYYVGKPYRRRGLTAILLRAAVGYAREHGATIVEGYPIEANGRLTGDGGYTGIADVYRDAGFEEVARPNAHQYIMRLALA